MNIPLLVPPAIESLNHERWNAMRIPGTALMLRLWWALGIIAVLSMGCVTEMGHALDSGAGRGTIVVWEKNGIPAIIFLDYRQTNYLTPHTFKNVPTGAHTIHLFSDHYVSVTGPKTIEVIENANNEASFEMQQSACGPFTIETQPAGATVTLNSVDFGPSPLTLGCAPSAPYMVSAYYGNLRAADSTVSLFSGSAMIMRLTLVPVQSIIIEYFSNINCPGCPAAAAAIEHLLEQLPLYKNFVYSIAYHTSWPSNNDPLYQAAKSDQEARIHRYGVDVDRDGLPIMYINGSKISFSEETSFITEAKHRIGTIIRHVPTTQISFGPLIADSARASGTIRVTNGNDSLQLFAAIVEDFVGYPAPLGTNQQRLFHSIFRGFLPEANGLALSSPDALITFSYAIAGNYSPEELSLIVFLQNKNTKEIVQALSTHLLPLE